MSDSPDESTLSNVQRARQLFENSTLHYYGKAGPVGVGSGRLWRPPSRPATTCGSTETTVSEDISDTISLPPPIIEGSPSFPKRDRTLGRVKYEHREHSDDSSGGGGMGQRKNSDSSIKSETPSTTSSTSSSSIKLSISKKISKVVSKNILKGKEKIKLVYDKNKNSNDTGSVNNNNNNSDSDERQYDKIRRESYKNTGDKENFLDSDDFAESTDTDDDTITGKTNCGKIHHILEELITTEEDYIKKLEFCIDNYLKYITNDYDLPVPLKGQQHLVFNEMEKIAEFHKNIFYPALADCNYDLDKIIDRIRYYVTHDYFYPYVLYAMNKPKSERVVKRNEQYFVDRQNEIGDRFGLPSLLMEPIQRLPKYRLIIYEMIKDYMKHYLNKNTTSTMESLCRAEKELQRVLDAANESITLNDIVIDDYEINMHHQGKFIKSGDFEINDPKVNKKFSGKIFLFTYSLIYTEYSANNKKKLIYRGYFDCTTFGVRQDCNESTNFDKKFYVFDSRPGHNEMEFIQSDNNLENWYKILQPIMLNAIIDVKSRNQMISEPHSPSIMRNQTFRFMRASRDSSGTNSTITIGSHIYEQLRFSNASTLSSGIGSNRSSRCSTASAHEVTEDTVFDKIIYSEKYYVHYLNTCREMYLHSIEDESVANKLQKFRRNFEQILNYHQNVYHPKFFEFEMGYATLFYLYETYLSSSIVETYKSYAVVAASACDILKTLYKDSYAKSPGLPIEEFVKLPIYRNKYYLSTVDQYVKDYMRSDTRDVEILEQAALLQAKFSKIHKQIDETFKLYSIKQNTIKLLLYGICEYSDIVSLDIFGTQNHRICIMENGLICIKFKTISDIQEEHYREIVFSHPYSINIHLRDSIKNPNKLHIDTVDQKSVAPSLTFRTSTLKTKFSNLMAQKLEIETEI